ncbi:MAG TPA: hypothetical protein P5105_04395 [Victivallales bacterium]|nr:hypothetical protein [Victivallales bacterium]HPO89885.1 hypothetical protein [Victivallales bacterium]HRR06503.1 hypothetical protein [Victivallales bacterium]
MKKMMFVAACVAAVLAITGCASMQVATTLNDQKIASTENNVSHINGDNWGVYLLWLPILTGDTAKPGSIAVMKDTVNVPSVVDMVTKKGKEQGATKVLDLVSSRSSIPVFWFIIPIVSVKFVEVSGNAVN